MSAGGLVALDAEEQVERFGNLACDIVGVEPVGPVLVREHGVVRVGLI